jgi:hypothetical protein
MRIQLSILLSTFILLASTGSGCAGSADTTKVSIYKNPDTGLLTWTAIADGFSVELIQLLPDFVRAIYAKHGFSPEEIEDIASYCVFGTIIKNTSGKTLTYAVSDWRSIDAGGTEAKIKTKSQWLAQWKKAGINFSWTLLPDVGTFYAGDWQQGFTTVKLPRTSVFDLKFVWQIEGVEHVGKIKQLRCAVPGAGQ